MIPLSFSTRSVGLPEDRCDFLGVQITHGGPAHLLYRYTPNLGALHESQGFATCDEGEEAVDSSQATVAGSDGYFPVVLQVLQKREHFISFQVGQRQCRDLPAFALSDKAQQQLPCVAIGQHSMTRQISLLPHPFMEERMQQLCEGTGFHSEPPVCCKVDAAFLRKRSLATCSSSGVMLR